MAVELYGGEDNVTALSNITIVSIVQSRLSGITHYSCTAKGLSM